MRVPVSIVSGLLLSALASSGAWAQDSGKVFHPPVPLGMSVSSYYAAASSDYADASAFLQQRQYELAYVRFERLASHGDVNAMREIGWMYANGQGRPADIAAALGWFERAAQGGDPRSMLILGTIHAKGIGVARNKERASYWLIRARDLGPPAVRGAAGDMLRSL